MKIREATIKDKRELLDYKREFKEEKETMHGGSGLDVTENFEEWLTILQNYKNKETVPNGKVQSVTYIGIVDERVVGILNLRYELNKHLLSFGGHIGYSVRKSERRKGYAKEMLRLSLDKAKEIGLKKVLITCDVGNIGSEKTILANGGVFESIYKDDEKEVKRFWIEL